MLEAIVSGIVQGIAEWLPVSSEGVILLLKKNVFKSQAGLDLLVREILFLHLGTFLAALIYFRKYIWSLIKAFFNYSKAGESKQNVLKFLILTTLISGPLGIGLLELFKKLDQSSAEAASSINLLIGLLLLVTAIMQLKAPAKGYKNSRELNNKDSIILGIAQGLAALPGLSRSGLTVSTLLLRKYNKVAALRLSFIMSLPIVLAGNIILNINAIVFDKMLLISLFFSFVFGLLTIKYLIKIAKQINFGYFVIIFGILTIMAAFI